MLCIKVRLNSKEKRKKKAKKKEGWEINELNTK